MNNPTCSRRSLVKGMAGAAAFAIVGGLGLAGCGDPAAKADGSAPSDAAFKIGVLQLTEHPALDAANKGFVNGYEDGTFKPDRNITRAEAVTLVNRTLDRHPDKNHFTKDMLVWPDNMDQTKWYYADMQEATNSHTYQMKENSDKTKYENWTKTLPIRNWEALEKAWSNANSSQGNGNVV